VRRSQLTLLLLVVLLLAALLAARVWRPPTSARSGLQAGLVPVPTSPRPTPLEEVFKGCPGEGDGADPELNRLKNRVDEADWEPVDVGALLGLRWPDGVEGKRMALWSPADRAQVAEHNGVPVQAEGYLLEARQEGPESTNCRSAQDLDFHLWLAAQPGDDRASRSVVVEVTPRVRARHPDWTVRAFQSLARQKSRVRISGWTMLDPEHPDQVGKTRGTIWEVHPVMRIDVMQAGIGWKGLGE
jgi:hypothetical protein